MSGRSPARPLEGSPAFYKQPGAELLSGGPLYEFVGEIHRAYRARKAREGGDLSYYLQRGKTERDYVVCCG